MKKTINYAAHDWISTNCPECGRIERHQNVLKTCSICLIRQEAAIEKQFGEEIEKGVKIEKKPIEGGHNVHILAGKAKNCDKVDS